MTTNRYLINDLDIIRPVKLLDRGTILPGLSGRYDVKEGWRAVILVGGAFEEVLPPGHHVLGRYRLWRDVEAIEVDTRVQTLNVCTAGEFTIAKPVSVSIDLDLGVEYRVSDPRRVALEIKTPLTSLYDRVIQAVRGVVVHATFDEFRTQGENIAQKTLQRLQAMQLPEVLGIEVFQVWATSMKGADVVAQQLIREYTTVRDWQLDNSILQQSQITPEWLMVHRPEIYQQILAGNTAVLRELIDKGLVDPAGFLNRPVEGGGTDWQSLLPNLGVAPGIAASQAALGGGTRPPAPQIAQPSSPASGANTRARIEEDLRYLQAEAGIQVEARAGLYRVSGLPDGTYLFQIKWKTGARQDAALRFRCPAEYPRVSPFFEIDVDGQASTFESAILRQWQGQYLVEIVREARGWYG